MNGRSSPVAAAAAAAAGGSCLFCTFADVPVSHYQRGQRGLTGTIVVGQMISNPPDRARTCRSRPTEAAVLRGRLEQRDGRRREVVQPLLHRRPRRAGRQPQQERQLHVASPAMSQSLPSVVDGGGKRAMGTFHASRRRPRRRRAAASPPSSSTAGASSLSSGAIAGIAVGCAVVGLGPRRRPHPTTSAPPPRQAAYGDGTVTRSGPTQRHQPPPHRRPDRAKGGHRRRLREQPPTAPTATTASPGHADGTAAMLPRHEHEHVAAPYSDLAAARLPSPPLPAAIVAAAASSSSSSRRRARPPAAATRPRRAASYAHLVEEGMTADETSAHRAGGARAGRRHRGGRPASIAPVSVWAAPGSLDVLFWT